MISGADIKSLNDFYHVCCSSEVTPEESVEWVKLAAADDVTEDFIKQLFHGELKDGQIHPDYYQNVAKKLSQAVVAGLGGANFDPDDRRNTLAAHLQHNIYAFSIAKSTAMMEQMKSALVNDKGEPATFGQFKNKALEVGQVFNEQYLRTGFNNARATAQMSAKWEKLKGYDRLEYRTVGDTRVRKEHKDLDRKVFATDDPIWNEIFPPNGWNCRCTVIPAKGAALSTYDEGVKKGKKSIAPYFKRNAGKERVIFTNQHPMMHKFISDEKYGKPSELQAEKHYNMKPVSRIYETAHKLPELKPLDSREAAIKWWDQNGYQDVKAKDGLSVRLDEKFFKKTIVQGKDKYSGRYAYAHKAPEVLQNPDEVWSHFHRGELQTVYIKYYQDKPYMFAMKEEKGKMVFETFHDLDEQTAINKRKGVLKYRK